MAKEAKNGVTLERQEGPSELAVLADFLAEHGGSDLLAPAEDAVRELLGTRRQLEELKAALGELQVQRVDMGSDYERHESAYGGDPIYTNYGGTTTVTLVFSSYLARASRLDVERGILGLAESVANAKAFADWQRRREGEATTLAELARVLYGRHRGLLVPDRRMAVRATVGSLPTQTYHLMAGDSLTLDRSAEPRAHVEVEEVFATEDCQSYLDDNVRLYCRRGSTREAQHSFVPIGPTEANRRDVWRCRHCRAMVVIRFSMPGEHEEGGLLVPDDRAIARRRTDVRSRRLHRATAQRSKALRAASPSKPRLRSPIEGR